MSDFCNEKMEKEIYLVSEGTIKTIYKVTRETKCFYFVRYNDKCEQKIPKKTMKTGSNWCTVNWHVATEKDLEFFLKRRIILEIQTCISKMLADLNSITLDQAKKIKNCIFEEILK